MIVQVAFAYEAEVLRPRKQRSEKALYVSSVDVEVRDASLDESFPVVTYVEDPFSEEARHEVTLRSFEGRLLAPSMRATGGRPVHRPADGLQDHADEPLSDGCVLRGSPPSVYHRQPRGDLASDVAVREVVDDGGRAEAEGDIRERAARLVLLDGMLWEDTQEPVLEAHRDRDYCFVYLRRSASVSPSLVFRLDQADAIRQSLGLRDKVELSLPSVVVHAPEALRYPADERALLEAGASVLSSMRDKVADSDRAYFDAYARLREALASAPKDPERGAELDEVAEAVREASGTLETWSASRAALAVARWEARDAVDEVALLSM